MNFLVHQVIANDNRLPDGPHFKHCYIYEGEHCSCGGNYQGPDPGPDLGALVALEEAFRRVSEDLAAISTPLADGARELLKRAVDEGDHEFIRTEGHGWSGRVGLSILELADRVEAVKS